MEVVLDVDELELALLGVDEPESELVEVLLVLLLVELDEPRLSFL